MAIVITLTDMEEEYLGFRLHTVLGQERKRAESPGYAGAKSGCMRGNDRYSSNGSASVGYYSTKEEPEPEHGSYNDFLIFNYGKKEHRQHQSSITMTGKHLPHS